MKLIRELASKLAEEQILEYVNKVCLDQLSTEHANLDNVLIQGLIAVSVNQSDVFVIHINNNLQTKENELAVATKKRPLEPDVVDLSDEDDCPFEGLLADTEESKDADKLLASIELKDDDLSDDHFGISVSSVTEPCELNEMGAKYNNFAEQDVDGNHGNQGTIRKEVQKQPGSANDADISIVRHHQRRKRTYTNSAMSIKREPQESNRLHQRKLNLSPNYLSSAEMEHFDSLISPDKNVFNMTFNDELVADLGCIDLDDSLGELSSHSSEKHLSSQYICSQCGIGCTSAEHLDKHQLLHLPFSVASVTGDIDIDLTNCHDDDSLIEAVTSSSCLTTQTSILSEHLISTVAPSGGFLDNHMPECDRLGTACNGCADEEKLSSDLSSTNSDIDSIIRRSNTGKSISTSQTSSSNSNDETDSIPKKKVKNIECPICGKTFLRTQHLKEHELTHTREKPHKCPHCRKCYRLKSHLNRHIQQCH